MDTGGRVEHSRRHQYQLLSGPKFLACGTGAPTFLAHVRLNPDFATLAHLNRRAGSFART
jgi:hypothetical protein